MVETITYIDFFSVFGMAMLPIVELKGAIPFGVLTLDMPFWTAFWIAYAGKGEVESWSELPNTNMFSVYVHQI